MESFTLSGASGWQRLATLLAADATFSGHYIWSWLYIKDTHASQTMIIKNLAGTTAPSSDSGISLAAGGTITIAPGTAGFIQGNQLWVKCSGSATTFDVAFVNDPNRME